VIIVKIVYITKSIKKKSFDKHRLFSFLLMILCYIILFIGWSNSPPDELIISPLRASPTTALSSAIPNINPPPRLCNPVQHIIKIS
ncbi:MAG: hypothetical protein FWG94_13615, partial [Oscillospiraceae bacterium]|nr:hypothetical protein [Oscillospiraceae bacterium]